MNKNALGVFCKKDKNFYYLECGENHVVNTVSRITKALAARGLFELSNDDPYTYTQYDVLKIKDALDQELPMVPIFLNEHIRKTFQSQKEEPSRWK